MSRRICVDLYNAIALLRPDWHHADDDKGAIKVVMTGSAADGAEWQQHIRNQPKRKELAKRFKDPNDPFKLVIVRDMWLTGFDAPCLHAMYVDRPMQGHGLMQAIARVNRVFKDKPGGLVVDYLGIADQLKQALAAYTEGDRGQTSPFTKQDLITSIEANLVGGGWFQAAPTLPKQDLFELIEPDLDRLIRSEDNLSNANMSGANLSKANLMNKEIRKWFEWYNQEHPHQALNYRTPEVVYWETRLSCKDA